MAIEKYVEMSGLRRSKPSFLFKQPIEKSKRSDIFRCAPLAFV